MSIGPVSETGRSMMASLQQAMSKGMPVEQAVAYVKSMARDGVAPLVDLYAMLNQVQRLKQPPAQMPQGPSIREQVNMMAQQRDAQDAMAQGLGGMPAPAMEQAQFAGGGIVNFAGGGFITKPEESPPTSDPEAQRRIQEVGPSIADDFQGAMGKIDKGGGYGGWNEWVPSYLQHGYYGDRPAESGYAQDLQKKWDSSGVPEFIRARLVAPPPDFTPPEGPGMAGGGVVALARGGGWPGSYSLTPEQIALQQRRAAGAQFLYDNTERLANAKLEDFPVLEEDAARIATRTVDEYGNVWEKTRDGEWKQVKYGRPGLRDVRNVESPMRREAEAWRASREGAGGGAKPPAGGSAAAGEGAAGEAAAAEAGGLRGLARSIFRNVAPIMGGVAALQTGQQYGEMRDAQREAGIKPEGVDKRKPWLTRRVEEMPEGWADMPLSEQMSRKPDIGPSPWELGEAGQAFLSNIPGLGSFIQNPFKTNTEAAVAAKPKPAAPAAAKPTARPAAAPAVREKGMFDDMLNSEQARLNLFNSAADEDKQYKMLDERAKKDGSGPYSKAYTDADAALARRLADLEESKKNKFGKALVAAGLAMAKSGAERGKSGGTTARLLEGAVAGLGGYTEAQEHLETEIKKSQNEYDNALVQLDTLRSGAKEKLRGDAYQRYNDAANRADSARKNIIAMRTVQAQIGQRNQALASREETARLGIQQREHGQIIRALEKNGVLQGLQMRMQVAKTPQEKQKAEQEYWAKYNEMRARLAQNPALAGSYAADVPSAVGAGGVDYSAADALVGLGGE